MSVVVAELDELELRDTSITVRREEQNITEQNNVEQIVVNEWDKETDQSAQCVRIRSGSQTLLGFLRVPTCGVRKRSDRDGACGIRRHTLQLSGFVCHRRQTS